MYHKKKRFLSHWDHRHRIIILFSSIIITAFQKDYVPLLFIIPLTLIIALLSGTSFITIIKRVLYPMIFVIPLGIITAFTAQGEILFYLKGFPVYSNGLILFALITLKTAAIVIIVTAMITPIGMYQASAVLHHLKFPQTFTALLIISYRYIIVLKEELQQINRALILRGGISSNPLRSISTGAALSGSILIRAYERTESVYHAMILRGFEGSMPMETDFKATSYDYLISFIIAGFFITIQFFILINGKLI